MRYIGPNDAIAEPVRLGYLGEQATAIRKTRDLMAAQAGSHAVVYALTDFLKDKQSPLVLKGKGRVLVGAYVYDFSNRYALPYQAVGYAEIKGTGSDGAATEVALSTWTDPSIAEQYDLAKPLEETLLEGMLYNILDRARSHPDRVGIPVTRSTRLTHLEVPDDKGVTVGFRHDFRALKQLELPEDIHTPLQNALILAHNEGWPAVGDREHLQNAASDLMLRGSQNMLSPLL
ncbi:MAG: hypothetical protein JWM81_873 [Candidatus Saccharibacteria bacterium]|nr:hypothetical protein [Candidatus Saccharibacteria bacterium]